MKDYGSSSVSQVFPYQARVTPVARRLESKVALVTGAARGIGKQIAIRFAQEGASLIVNDIDGDAAAETSESLQSFGCRSIPFQADVSDRQSIAAMVASSAKAFGGIDILVNNAGIIVFGSLLDCLAEDWKRVMDVDLTGAFHCTQYVAEQMIKQNRGGRLIHIGSVASILPAPQQAAYSVAKAGLAMISRMAALELCKHRITSNLICPQGAVTGINRELLKDPQIMSQLEESIPAGRLSTVEEIAGVVAFLASDESDYITGIELLHDGGVSISGLWWR